MSGRKENFSGSLLWAQSCHHRSLCFVSASAVLFCALFCIPPDATAANGDLLQEVRIPALLDQNLVDICLADDGTFWVVSRSSGMVYHLDSALQHIPQDDILNPFGAFNILFNPVLTKGIAYRTDTGTLLIMAQTGGAVEVAEIQLDGTLVQAQNIVITPPLEGGNLSGLTWDPLTSQFWYRDRDNDVVVRSDLNGNPVSTDSVPGNDPPENQVYGEGLDFQLHPNGLTGFVYVTAGDIFSLEATRIDQMTITGVVTGVSVPIPAAADASIRGFVLADVNSNSAAVCVGDSGGESVLFVIDEEAGSPLPPSGLSCLISKGNEVQLSWKNNGIGLSGIYPGGLHVLRDGELLAVVPGATEIYTDREPPEGDVTYSVSGSDGGQLSPPTECTIRTGTGGLVQWLAFPGAKIHDICRNPANGDFYVTDNIGGVIYRYDQSLTLYPDTVEDPNPFSSTFQRPGGIAFDPDGDGGQGSLMVARTDGVVMRRLNLRGDQIAAGIPMDPPSGENVGSGMTYDPSTGFFTYIDSGSNQLVFLRINENDAVEVTSVEPSALFAGIVHLGIAFDPVGGRYYASFDDGALVREIFPNGAPANFDMPLDSLGASASMPSGIGGVETAGNCIAVCGPEANALFLILIAPSGEVFIRGDADNSGLVDMSDAVYIAQYLFGGGAPPLCDDAADANDDGVIDVSDTVFVLFFLFLGGASPPEPYPSSGTDPTFMDNLDC